MKILALISRAITKITPNFIRTDNEANYYRAHIWKADQYINHNWWDPGENEGSAVIHIERDGCYIFSMGVQEYMIKCGMLKETWRDEYRDSSILDNWLEENMQGFYDTRGWGNGRGNYGQTFTGLWHVEVYIMREEDATLFKMTWA